MYFIDITKEFNYDGYYGIEYEGLVTGEYEGINKTKTLLERYL